MEQVNLVLSLALATVPSKFGHNTRSFGSRWSHHGRGWHWGARAAWSGGLFWVDRLVFLLWGATIIQSPRRASLAIELSCSGAVSDGLEALTTAGAETEVSILASMSVSGSAWLVRDASPGGDGVAIGGWIGILGAWALAAGWEISLCVSGWSPVDYIGLCYGHWHKRWP